MVKVVILDYNTLYYPEMKLTVSGRTPSAAMCRKILELNPDIPDQQLVVYREGKISYIINSIRNWVKRSISDNDRGMSIGNYNEFKL